jgi:hypothetical protein
MDKPLFKSAAVLAGALLLAACTEAPQPAQTKTETAPKAEPAAPPEAVAARTAFFEMYKPAHSWAADLLPLTLSAGEVPGIKNEDGKAGMWTAVFVSPTRREARTFVYAVADHGTDIHKGISVGGAEVWSGPTAKSRPFQVAEFVTNSDDAFKAASQKAAAWLHAHPDKKVTITLADAGRFSGPVWYIMWGDAKSGYLAFVNATTGLPMK